MPEEKSPLQDREVTATIECHMEAVRKILDPATAAPPASRERANALAAALITRGERIKELGELFSTPEP